MPAIGFDENGLRIDETFVGRSFTSKAADELLGTDYRKREFRVGGKIERRHRLYDALGIACLEYILVAKIVTVFINLSKKQTPETENTFRGELRVGGVKIENQMSWKSLSIPSMRFTEFLRGEFVWEGEGLSCGIRVLEIKKLRNPDRMVQICSVCLDFTRSV